MTSRVLISKIHCTLSANQKTESSMYNNTNKLTSYGVSITRDKRHLLLENINKNLTETEFDEMSHGNTVTDVHEQLAP